jgi:hypothetical protein
MVHRSLLLFLPPLEICLVDPPAGSTAHGNKRSDSAFGSKVAITRQ